MSSAVLAREATLAPPPKPPGSGLKTPTPQTAWFGRRGPRRFGRRRLVWP